MRIYVLVTAILLILTSCQQPIKTEMHIGCGKEEISKDGTCGLAEENNAEIFDKLNQDLIKTQDVKYTEGVTGYLAQPSEGGIYPGIVMIHEWWGLNENIKDMAELLAQEGYVVLAVDLYKGRIATESSEAGKLASDARDNPEESIKNMQDAVSYLRELPNVRGDRIASIGWCFGGGQSLQLALSGEELAATVIYYGNLIDDKDKLIEISWPVLGIFGEEDTGIPVSSVNSFKKALTELGVENVIYVYPGVGHAFANPSGARYAPEETKDAWEKTAQFLDEHLK